MARKTDQPSVRIASIVLKWLRSVAKEETVGGFGEESPGNYSQNELIGTYAIGRGMVIGTEQIGTNIDQNRVVYFDLPLGPSNSPVVPAKGDTAP